MQPYLIHWHYFQQVILTYFLTRYETYSCLRVLLIETCHCHKLTSYMYIKLLKSV